MKGAAADWILSQPWAITEQALGVILSVAERVNESPEAVEAKIGRPLDNTRETIIRDGVAIIPVTGPISRYANFFTEISGGTTIDDLAKDFRTALDDRSVRAIVLGMDTPGGAVSGVNEFASHVAAARGQGKPIVAYVGNLAASAGYWIASAADMIVADPTAMLGSIGVVAGVRKPADSKPGMARTVEFVSSQSPRKRPDPETEAGKSQIQSEVDDLADVFIDTVARNRAVDRASVIADFGGGGILVGAKAVDAGMADGLGSLEHVIACLARGEMPCPPPKKAAPKKADNPRRAAMSEPKSEETMSAAEADGLRKRLADAEERERAAIARAQEDARARAEADREAIEARADAFVSDFAGKATATTFARSVRAAFVQAATDDKAHPVPGAKAHRVDALREALKGRAAPTKESIASDAAEETRALESDPARPNAEQDEDLASAEATARKVGQQLNGKK